MSSFTRTALMGAAVIILMCLTACGTQNTGDPISQQNAMEQAQNEHDNVNESEDIPEEHLTEDASKIRNLGIGTYENGQSFAYTFESSNTTLTIGVKDTSLEDAIYLNPICTTRLSENVGIIAHTSRINLECSDTGKGSDASGAAKQYPGEHTFLVRNRTYDTLIKAQYTDPENYGIRWVNTGEDGELKAGTTVDFLLVTVPGCYLIGICRIEIGFNPETNTYAIKSLVNADVAQTGEISPEMRDYLVSDAKDFICNKDRGPIMSIADDPYWETALKLTKVHKTQRGTYFNPAVSPSNELFAPGRYSNADVFAVNIPWDGYGFLTIYYAPQMQIDGLNRTWIKGKPESEWELTVFAYDLFCPQSKDTLSGPPGFKEWLVDE